MPSVQIIEYTEDKRDIWNEFVWHSNNGTIFHDLDFLSYHPKGKFDEHHLMFYKGDIKGGRLIGVMPLAFFREQGQIVAKSPYGASFGGIIVESLLTLEDSEYIVTGLINYLRSSGATHLYITPPPHIYDRSVSDYIELCLIRNGGTIVKREITSVTDLTAFETDPFPLYTSECRRNIRKAEKSGIIIRESSDEIEVFYSILMETLNRHNKTPTHKPDELSELIQLLPKSFKLDMAYIGDRPIGGVFNFICNQNVVLAFYNCHKLEYRAYYTVNLLLHRGVLWAKQRGFKYLDLGTSTQNMEPIHSLFRFKESLGAMGVFRDTYKLDL